MEKSIQVKKKDIILIAIVLVVAIAGFLVFYLTQKSGDTVIVTIDGVLYNEYPLNNDIEVDIPGINGGTNHLVIKDGYADMTDADCPDKICVDSRKISKTGESIICLPHKVVVKIEGNTVSEVDGSTN